MQTSQLMLYREIIAVCSQVHTKHINTLCGQNVELLNVKLAVHIVTTGLYGAQSILDRYTAVSKNACVSDSRAVYKYLAIACHFASEKCM